MSTPLDIKADLCERRRLVELLITAEVLARRGEPGPLGRPVSLQRRLTTRCAPQVKEPPRDKP
ncbi:MAG: hypothetical protein MUC50_18320 [Myxococcota bacterium]|nr:hypothetical protein [Myxococcota bacterium]